MVHRRVLFILGGPRANGKKIPRQMILNGGLSAYLRVAGGPGRILQVIDALVNIVAEHLHARQQKGIPGSSEAGIREGRLQAIAQSATLH